MELTALGSWQTLLAKELASERFLQLCARLEEVYAAQTVYPPRERLFSAFALTPPETLRCVILGQDPYHEPGQAMGLAFSVPEGTSAPPSLRNILQEREDDLGCGGRSVDLSDWARQGVLLLNTVLTVEAGKANAHRNLGWQPFTDAVIAAASALPQPVAFVLWGAQAQAKKSFLQPSSYPRLVLCAPHPSPLSSYRGFFGSRPFSRVNAFLRENGASEIQW